MKYSKNKKNSKHKKPIFAILGLLFLALITILIIKVIDVVNKNNSETITEPINDIDYINYSPPTESELSSGNDIKEAILDNQQNDNLPDSASVVIVDANQYDDEVEVRAFAANVIQNGSCIVTFSKNAYLISRTVDAYADATTTPCINIVIPISEFPEGGTWNIKVEYESDSVRGVASTSMELNR